MKAKKIKQEIKTEEVINAFYKNLARIEEVIDKNEDWFKILWETNADEFKFFEFANVVFKKTYGGGAIPYTKFKKGWQYRNVLSEDYDQAKKEFANLILGWW